MFLLLTNSHNIKSVNEVTMGILGTSKQEEAQLREAALSNDDSNYRSRQSTDASSNNTSSYETADEELTEDESIIGNKNIDDFTKINQNTVYKDEGTADFENVQQNSQYNQAMNQSVDNNNTEAKSIVDFNGSDNDVDENENDLNRKYSVERIASHISIEEAGEKDIVKTLSHGSTSTNNNNNMIEVSQLDWDGPDDMGNPQNWPKWKKWFITFTVAIVCLCISLGSSLYVSGVPEIMLEFNVSQELCLVGLTLYLVGLALGPVLMAPLSEIIGRRWIYITSFPISMLFTMGIGLSQNIRTILVLRFFCGYIASPALSIAGGTISDLWGSTPSELSIAVALFCVAPFLGPIIGPIVGGFAAEHKSWKWTMWISLMFSGFILPFILICPETYKPIILINRATKRGLNVNKPIVNKAFIKNLISVSLLKPIKMLFVEPIIALLSIYTAFVFAVLFGFFEAFPIIFRGAYAMDLGVSGLPFIGVGLGLIFGVLFYILLDLFYYFPKNPNGTRGKFDDEGKLIWDAPEKKLLVGKVGAVCLPIALFWLGWTGRTGNIHWMAPTAAGFPFGFGLILVFFAVVLYFSMSFPPINVASAIAANNLLRYIVASVFPLFTVQMYERLKIGWATSIFAFIALLMAPFPFIFAKWGPSFRARSPYGYHAYFKEIAAQKAAAAAAATNTASSPAAPSSGVETITSATSNEQNDKLSNQSVENKV